ncbi:unnamed protein product [Prorocentrum cordatum]|uniref:Anoctamin transmembrane domain-containing protein n=1 Tax=Prorocentrum cordatum TaxID=2364126 RepID=A0ABN9Y6X7_9DINO|nr:unnamed protein product [Polarella glacialis]
MGVHRCTRCVPPPPFFVLVLSSFRVPTSAALWTARGARHASPEDPPKREVVVKQIRNDITEVGSEIRAVFNSSISKAVADDFDRFGYIWMGGWRVRWPVLIVELSELFICLAWLVYYAVFLHKDENPQILRDWHARVDHHDYVGSPLRGCANINREDSAELEPDLVLVFHHPDAAHPDDLQDMSLEDVIHVIHPSLRLDHKSASIPLDAVLSRMLSTLGVQASELWSDQGDAETDRWKQILSRSVRQPRRQLRTCFLQDVVQLLSENMHFHTEAFRSESGTGLHVAVSLRSPEVTRHYIAKNDMYLQIRQDVIKELGVHQPRDEFASSPPYIPYDTKVVRELFAAGRLPSEDLAQALQEGGPHVVSQPLPRHPQRALWTRGPRRREGSGGGAIDFGLVPVARERQAGQALRRLGRLAQPGDGPAAALDPRVLWVQGRLSVRLEPNGLYTRGLLALIPAALLFELVDMRQLHGHKRTMPVFGPALVIIVWSTVLREVWDQEQHFFTTFWSLDTERMRRAMRPQFRGSRRPAHYDNSMFELHWPHGRTSSYAFRRFVSKVVMFAFCCMVAPSIAWWYHTFSHDMNMVASLILSVQIAVLDKVCAYVVRGLTDWENHKFQDAYFDSFISKMFLFQCVNHYLPFIYLGVRQEFLMHGNCGEEVCLSVLRKQLCLRQCICLLDCIFAFLDSVAHVEWQLRWRRVKLPLLEAQSYFGEYRTLQQYRHTMRLLIPLGSSLIFGAVAPIMVIINFLVFAVELRCQAYLLTTYYKRPVPRIMQGIGEMKHIVERLTFIGTLTSSTLVVLFGDLFKDSHNQAKVAGWCTFYCLAIAIQGAVEWAIKGESEDLSWGP